MTAATPSDTQPEARILVVDDEANIVELARMYLEQEGFRVQSASDGTKALEMIARQPPALMVLDLMLPALDGWEVCRQIRMDDELKCIPVVVVTVKTRSADRARALQVAKVHDYLTKPFLPQALLHSVGQALGVEF